MSYILDGKKIKMGVCYYPEHWPREIWGSDLERMLDAGIQVVRIAEFAWSKVEPTEGNFTYDFFDDFLNLCEQKGMKVIFCTPTATPPAWLTKKYPEVLNRDINGVRFRHGSRRHYNYNSGVYFDKSALITEKVASHYGKRKCIVGWQLDNELNCEVNEFYSEADTEDFRWWLLNKYHDLDNLNEAWGTVFWNQTYTEWDEIYVPRRTCNNAQNPHQMLDYYRFISSSVIRFAKKQAQIINEYKKPDDFITTNGLFGHLDNHLLTKECLDFMTYDSYPNFTNRVGTVFTEGDLRDRWWSKNLSETRSVSKIFGIMEQQTGANGWTIWPGVPNPRPGQITLWTMQSIAHGADYISYFRWRTATVGTEMYWHGILDYSGRDNSRLIEVKKISNLLQKLSTVAGKEYKAEVAILKDYDNVFDAEIDKWHSSIDEISQNALFETLQKNHTPFDYVYFYGDGCSEELSKYKLIFYPHPIVSNTERAKLLEKYVKAGGILVIGCRAGQKDMNGRCVMDKLPGVFSKVSATDVCEYSFIQPDSEALLINTDQRYLKAELFCEQVSALADGIVMGTYVGGDYSGEGAVIRNEFGKGTVYYYGSSFNRESIEFFLNKAEAAEPFSDVISVGEEVELAKRGDCLFVLNYSEEPQKIYFKRQVFDVISKETLDREVSLPEFGFLIVKDV